MNPPDMPNNTPMFSRSANIFGCLDDSIELRINGDMKLRVARQAREKGFHDSSEYIRTILAVELDGKEHVARVITERVFGIGASVGQTQGGQT